jgi:hypothetical protein
VGASVTREAVESGYEGFVEDTIERAGEEFDVGRALRRGVRGPGASVIDRLLKNSDTLWRRVVRPELDAYERAALDQFAVLLDYVESDADFDAYRERLLDRDPFAGAIDDSLSASERSELEATLLDRQRRVAEAVRPVAETAETEFWPAVEASLTAAQARALIEEHFAFTGPVREHRSAFVLSTAFEPGDVLGGLGGLLGKGLPTVNVTYTDEAIRAMSRAEQAVIETALEEVDRRFDS